MRMKVIFIATAAALICLALCALTACGNLNELSIGKLPENYDGMEKAGDKSAFELFSEAYENFLNEDNFRRVQYYDFEATSGANQDMQIKTTRKINGDKIYNEEVVLAAGLLKLNEGKKVYFDGDKAYSLYFNDKKRVPGKGDDVFAVTEWDDLGAYDEERYKPASETKASFRTQLIAYNLGDKSYLAASSDDSVYRDDSGIFYFTLIIDCSDKAMKGVQSKVAKAIADKTSGNPDDLKMKSDTTVRAAVKNIGGKMRFTLLEIRESYDGKLSFVKAGCSSKYYNEFYYEKNAGVATEAELKGVSR